MTDISNYPKKIIPAVTGLAIREDGKFLLTERNDPSSPLWHLKWNIPGGAIEWGESPEEALRREFMEELNVSLEVRPLSPYPVPITALWYGRDTGEKVDAHILLLTYAVDIGGQRVDITKDPEHETISYDWFNFSDLESLDCLPQTKETVRAILTLINKSV